MPESTMPGIRPRRCSFRRGQPPKVISERLGHSTVTFTMDVYTEVATEYTEVATELAEAAPVAIVIAAFIPRRAKSVPNRGVDDH